MVNSKDILTRLQNGEKAEDIANELINALNDANDAYNKEAEAKKAEDEAKAKKVADMQDILDLLHDFCIEYYCDNNEDIDAVEEAFTEFTAEKVIEIVEEAGAAVLELDKQIDQLGKWFDTFPTFSFGKLPKSTVKLKIDKDARPADADADAVIGKFLKSIGLK